MATLPPQYNPQEVEDKIYRIWEKSGYFNPDRLPPVSADKRRQHADQRGRGPRKSASSQRKSAFTIVVPPPNITGELHMGHALNATIQDILIRKKRMEGYKTLWLPGTDHAGIATQNAVEKQLKKEGLTRHDLGREKLLEKVWGWKEKYGNVILEQFKRLGSSMDWSRTRFTMDQNYQEAVKEAFLHYYKKGWIYRAERVINWCSRCATSLSDLELEYKEVKGTLYYINYPLADGGGVITVATTRPETMLGDTAVAVNPRDKRYKNFVGREVLLPIQNRKIPVLEDKAVDPSFGTGAVKVTPAHDLLDAEIGERHKLSAVKVIGPDGKMTKDAGPICEGLKVGECRTRIVEELKKQKFLEREEVYAHNIAQCYRCGAVIEPIPSVQWFLKMDKLAEAAVKAVKSGKVKFHPQRWQRVYLDWLKNIKDWCISRQIWWGHKIPVEGADDVLDTWFSSALWPLATLGWPASVKTTAGQPKPTGDLKDFYPTSALSTARDIINLWVARMVFSGLEFMGREPFQDVIIHATILTKDGRRMSKSLGTGVDPMDLITRYGADATRFGLIWQAMGNQDIHWSEEHVVAGRKFGNKVWNASRFILMSKPPRAAADALKRGIVRKNLTSADKNILAALEKTKKEVSRRIEKYEFGPALHALYDFFWHEFCDHYLEISKSQIKDPKTEKVTQEILLCVLTNSLRLLHPFMPFITEEIWGNLPIKGRSLLLVEPWPT